MFLINSIVLPYVYFRHTTTTSQVWAWLVDALGEGVWASQEKRLVEMFHASSPAGVKEDILHEFSSTSSCVRVLICTVAFGMGVSIPDVRCIIHFGAAKDFISYAQEVKKTNFLNSA